MRQNRLLNIVITLSWRQLSGCGQMTIIDMMFNHHRGTQILFANLVQPCTSTFSTGSVFVIQWYFLYISVSFLVSCRLRSIYKVIINFAPKSKKYSDLALKCVANIDKYFLYCWSNRPGVSSVRYIHLWSSQYLIIWRGYMLVHLYTARIGTFGA